MGIRTSTKRTTGPIICFCDDCAAATGSPSEVTSTIGVRAVTVATIAANPEQPHVVVFSEALTGVLNTCYAFDDARGWRTLIEVPAMCPLIGPRVHRQFRLPPPQLAAFAAAIALAGCVLSVLRSSNDSRLSLNSARNGAEGCRLKASPDPVDLGILSPGQSAVAKVVLQNQTSGPFHVTEVDISCPCLCVDPPSVELAPGASVELAARFDPSHDPEFRGGLSIEVTGRSRIGEVEFRTRVHLEVQATPDRGASWRQRSSQRSYAEVRLDRSEADASRARKVHFLAGDDPYLHGRGPELSRGVRVLFLWINWLGSGVHCWECSNCRSIIEDLR